MLGTTIVGNTHLGFITPLPFSEGDWIPRVLCSLAPSYIRSILPSRVCRSDTDGLTHYSVLPPMGTQALSDAADWKKTYLLGGTCGDRISRKKSLFIMRYTPQKLT